MKLSIVSKVSLLSALLVVITASVISGVFYKQTTDLLVQQELEDMSNRVTEEGFLMRSHIDSLKDNVLFASRFQSMEGMHSKHNGGGKNAKGKIYSDEWSHHLEKMFYELLKTESQFLQIRFIDNKGLERLRVERKGQEIEVIPKDKLQNKINHRYVRETLKLEKGLVYISEINLNREDGSIVVPHQEMLRIATPVFSEATGEVVGLVIINSEIGHELHDIEKNIKESGREIYITNDHGGYLVHPDRSKTYGFDMGHRYRVQEDMPLMAKFFLPGNIDRQLLLMPGQTKNNNVTVYTKIFFDPSRPKRYIAVGITESYDAFVKTQTQLLRGMLVWVVILVAIGVFIALLFSLRLARPLLKMARAMKEYSNDRTAILEFPVYKNDEIGILAKTFKEMVLQVEEARKDLEKKVQDRTMELEVSEARQRVIVDSMMDGLITIDDHGIVRSYNKAVAEIFGYEADEVIGKNVSMLMPEPHRSEHDAYLHRYHETGDARVIGIDRTVEGMHKDGSLFPMELSVSKTVQSDENIYVGIVRDITKRKQIENEILEAKQIAEKASNAKSEFLARMSHELRTPMNAILGFGQLLQLDEDQLSAEHREGVKHIMGAGNHLLHLINEVLDIAKVDAGKMEISLDDISINEALDNSMLLVKPLAEKKNVTIYHDTTDNVLVRGDMLRLKQVLVNLLSNAVKYNHEGGEVSVSFTCTENKMVHITIADTGIGIKEEDQDRVFTPFERVTIKGEVIEGAGVGLTITKKIVEAMAGNIGFESDYGNGSTFWFELPEGAQPVSRPENSEANEQAAHTVEIEVVPLKILYVEDNAVNLKLMQQMLKKCAGYDVLSAPNAELGIEIALEQHPDLIFMDIDLPGMDGFEALEALHKDKKTSDIPVVAVSAHAMPEQVEEGMNAGFVDYLTKPVKLDELLSVLNKNLTQKKIAS